MTKTLITALILGSAASAFAQQPVSTAYDRCAASESRSEVAAEVADARAHGSLRPAGEVIGLADQPASNESRAEVAAEVKAARSEHTLAPAGELVPLPDEHPSASMSRADVATEVARAQSDGTLPAPGDAGVLTGPSGTSSDESCAARVMHKG